MCTRRLPFLLWLLVLCVSHGLGQDVPFLSLQVKESVNVFDYFPLEVGNRWVYEDTYATDYGNPPRRVRRTSTREVTIVGRDSIPEGTVVHWREGNTDVEHDFGPGWSEEEKAAFTKPSSPATHRFYLVRGSYVLPFYTHSWDAAAKALTERCRSQLDQATPDFFFPMTIGIRWSERQREQPDLEKLTLFRQGKGGAPNPGNYYWVVESRQDVTTPYGEIEDAFRLVYRTLGGPHRRWFKPGIGIVRESSSHSGTYIETDSVLKELHLQRP